MDPMVYARFHLPGTSEVWYVTEGVPDGRDFLFFGFVAGPNEFRQFRLSELERIRGLFDSHVERDQTFTEGLELLLRIPNLAYLEVRSGPKQTPRSERSG